MAATTAAAAAARASLASCEGPLPVGVPAAARGNGNRLQVCCLQLHACNALCMQGMLVWLCLYCCLQQPARQSYGQVLAWACHLG